MQTELVSIPTEGEPLDGAWYVPAGQPRGAVLLFHGNTMNFYTGAPRFLPPALTELGFACLAFNRRGHDILSIRNSRALIGAAFQTAAEGMTDNDAAAAWLMQRGFAHPIVIGHSNGGMLAAQFAARHPETRALVMLSAHAGGPATVPRACAVGQLAGDQLAEVTANARRHVAAGQGHTLMLLAGWWNVISAASFLDRLERTPDTLAAAPLIHCPVLYLRGDQEDPVIYPTEEFQRRAAAPCDVVIVPDCDHFYHGCEAIVTQIVANWIDSTVNAE